MPLVTLHTRLTTLLHEARAIKQYCAEATEAMAAGPVSANAVVSLGQRLAASIADIIEPSQQHAGLADYAALQFGDPSFGLNARMAGLRALLVNAITAARATIPTTAEGYLLKDTWNDDGSVTVRVLAPSATGQLRAALQMVAANIPE
jgi:hypothetical protein